MQRLRLSGRARQRVLRVVRAVWIAQQTNGTEAGEP
jgi:hypothetical protein